MLPPHGGGVLSLSAKKSFFSFFPSGCLRGFPKPHLFVWVWYSVLKDASAATVPLQNVPLKLERCWQAAHMAIALLPLIWLHYGNPAQLGHLNLQPCLWMQHVTHFSRIWKLFSVVSQQLQIKESSEKYVEVLIPLWQFSLLPFQASLLFVYQLP